MEAVAPKVESIIGKSAESGIGGLLLNTLPEQVIKAIAENPESLLTMINGLEREIFESVRWARQAVSITEIQKDIALGRIRGMDEDFYQKLIEKPLITILKDARAKAKELNRDLPLPSDRTITRLADEMVNLGLTPSLLRARLF